MPTTAETLRVGYEMPLVIGGVTTHSVGDVTITKSYTEIPIKRKGDRDVRYKKGMRDRPIDFTIDNNESDNAYKILKAASDTDKAVTIQVGSVEDKFIVTKFDESEPVDDIVTVDVSIRLATPDAEDLDISGIIVAKTTPISQTPNESNVSEMIS
ncbi:MAG: hypothetical protein LBK06_02770 [Planctomycetaceae bacterium]|jgi:hypothetical protein|nr:hypothetical protein [Planctomycetaceae bacterium]